MGAWKDLLDILSALENTPTATLMIVAGLVFILLALAGKLAGQIEIPPSRQVFAGVLGTLFLVLGLFLAVLQNRPDNNITVSATTTTLPLSITASSTETITIPNTPEPTVTPVASLTPPTPVSTITLTPSTSALTSNKIPDPPFYENFNDGIADGWINLESRRASDIVDGQYVLVGEPTLISVVGDESWQNYTFTVKAQTLSGRGDEDYGVVFRQSNGCNLYLFQVFAKDNYVVLRKYTGGDDCTHQKSSFFPNGYEFKTLREAKPVINPNSAHFLRIEINGTTIKCYFKNGDAPITSSDLPIFIEQDASHLKGRVGLRVGGNSQTFFDDIEVTANP